MKFIANNYPGSHTYEKSQHVKLIIILDGSKMCYNSWKLRTKTIQETLQKLEGLNLWYLTHVSHLQELENVKISLNTAYVANMTSNLHFTSPSTTS